MTRLYAKRHHAVKSQPRAILRLLFKNLQSFHSLDTEPESMLSFQVTDVGAVREGVAYYREADHHYGIVGVEMTVVYQHEFMEEPVTQRGFCGIWMGKAHPASPFIFNVSRQGRSGTADCFDNGCGDTVTVGKELVPAEAMRAAFEAMKDKAPAV